MTASIMEAQWDQVRGEYITARLEKETVNCMLFITAHVPQVRQVQPAKSAYEGLNHCDIRWFALLSLISDWLFHQDIFHQHGIQDAISNS